MREKAWEDWMRQSIGAVTAVVGLALLGGPSGAAPSPGPPAGGPVDVARYGASPDAAPAKNVAAINAALAAGRFVQITAPGVYRLNDHLTIYPDSTLRCGPGVTIRQTGPVCIIRNAHMLAAVPDANITIEGGTWDGDYTGPSPGDQHAPTDLVRPLPGVEGEIDAIGVNGFTLRDVTIRHCRAFGVQVSACNDVTIEDVRLDIAKDGIHVNGPAARVRIANLRGYTGDDFIALNAWDWRQSSPTVGDITDVDISDICQLAQSPSVPGNTNQFGLIKFLPGTRGGARADIRRVHVSGVTGVNSYRAFTFLVDRDPDDKQPSGAGEVADVTFDHVAVRTVHSALFWLGQDVRSLDVRDVYPDPAGTGPLVYVNAGTTTQALTLSGLNAPPGPDALFDVRGTVDSLTVSDSHVRGDAALVTARNGGHVGQLTLTGDTFTGGGGLFDADPGAASLPTRIALSACAVTGAAHVFLAGQPLMVRAAACDFAGLTGDLVRADGSVFTGLFASCTSDFTGAGVPVSLAHGGAVRVPSSDMGFDLALLARPAVGDAVVNTNAALPCGPGPCVYTGAAWKNSATGATWRVP